MESFHSHAYERHDALPPGFRFHPTDEELITYYLLKKVLDAAFSSRAIAEVDLNKCEPWHLPGKAKMGEKEGYFFSLRDRKYPTGLRTNRATESGFKNVKYLRPREMGRVFVVDLEGRTYRCKYCKTHLALADELVSRAFRCRRGKAYLFNNVVNITIGPHEERMMLSGMHTIADIFCCCCGQIVGWKYESAKETAQKYKEGKFVLERGRIIDGIDSEFYIDTRLSISDAEEDAE